MDWLANLFGSVANAISLAHFQPRMPRSRRVAWGLWVPVLIGIVQMAEHGQFMSASSFLGMNLMTLIIGVVVAKVVDLRAKYGEAKIRRLIRQVEDNE